MFNLTPWKKNGNSRPLVPWNREKSVARLRDEFDALFDRLWNQLPAPFGPTGRGAFWGFDIEDRGKEIVVTAEAPGFEPADFDCEISGNLLTIKAEKRKELKGRRSNGRHEGQAFSSFQRSATLPPGIIPDKIEAKYRHGVLEVHVPKNEAAKAKQIPVKT